MTVPTHFKHPTKGQIIAAIVANSPTPLDVPEIRKRTEAVAGSVTDNMIRQTCDYLCRTGLAERDDAGPLVRYGRRTT